MKPVGKPDAGNPHVRFDERVWETGRRQRQHPRPAPTLPRYPAFHPHIKGIAAIFLALPCGVVVNPEMACAQSAIPHASAIPLHFDVVAIRENKAGAAGGETGMSLRDGILQVSNMLLKSVITSAYGVHEGLIFGLPQWAEDAHYDIRARVIDADPAALAGISREQRRALMAGLLEDRFHMKVHPVMKVLPVYDLITAKGGPKFTHRTGSAEPRAEVHKSEYTGVGVSMPQLSSFLEEIVGRSVADKTGLSGAYDLHLRFAPDDTAAGRDSFPSIFTAVEDQLGLKLQANKGPVKTLFVDHVERPSAN